MEQEPLANGIVVEEGGQVIITFGPSQHMVRGTTIHMCLECMFYFWQAMAQVLVNAGYIEPVQDGDEEDPEDTGTRN